MSDERHLMVCTDGTDAESLFECTVSGCGRRLVFDHTRARVVVIDAGLSFVPHHGASGLASLSVGLGPLG